MEEDMCLKCKHFLSIGEDGQCDIYDIPNHGISICFDWGLKEE